MLHDKETQSWNQIKMINCKHFVQHVTLITIKYLSYLPRVFLGLLGRLLLEDLFSRVVSCCELIDKLEREFSSAFLCQRGTGPLLRGASSLRAFDNSFSRLKCAISYTYQNHDSISKIKNITHQCSFSMYSIINKK